MSLTSTISLSASDAFSRKPLPARVMEASPVILVVGKPNKGKKKRLVWREGTFPLASQIINIRGEIRNLFNVLWQTGNTALQYITCNWTFQVIQMLTLPCKHCVSPAVREPRLSYSVQGQHISESAPGALMGKFKWGHLLYYLVNAVPPPRPPQVQFILLTVQHGK